MNTVCATASARAVPLTPQAETVASLPARQEGRTSLPPLATHAKTLLPVIVAFGLGALTPLGFAPFRFFFVPVLTLAGLFRLWLDEHTAGRCAWIGFAFGLGIFGVGVSWLYVALDTGKMSALLGVMTSLLFCALFACLPALIGWLQNKSPASASFRLVLLMPMLWALSDWTRTWLFSGFPWLDLGYSQVPGSPLDGFAPLFGVLGVSLAVAMSAALLIQVFRPIGTTLRAAAMAGLIGLWLAGLGLKQVEWTQPYGKPLTVSLLQGDVSQDKKFHRDIRLPTLRTYQRLIRASKGRLVVLPETAFPMFISDVPEGYLQRLADHAKAKEGDILVGALEYNGNGAYFNSVFSLGRSPIQVYRKHHLVPFGEFVPFGSLLRPLYDKVLHVDFLDTSRGPAVQPLLEVAGQRVAVSVCYEDAFGEGIARALPRATLLVNVSNDAWYGASIALAQHLQMAQTRALETGRSMLRATNTGMTAIIDWHGNIRKALPDLIVAGLDGQVQGRSGATPYVKWRDRPLLIAGIALLAAGFFPRRPSGRRRAGARR